MIEKLFEKFNEKGKKHDNNRFNKAGNERIIKEIVGF